MDPREIFKKVKQPETKREYNFALVIGYGVIKGALWAVDEGKTRVFSLSKVIDWEEENDLLKATDRSFSEVVEKTGLLEEEEPKKIIFGLPHPWVEGEKIIPEKLKFLKKLCQDLDLKPVGFVVTTEAIIKYLKILEGVPPNAILVNVAQKEIEVALLRSGKIVGSSVVKRSDNLGDDIAEGLSRIKSKEVLPARIILYDSNQEIEEKKEEILSYPWLEEEKGFNFLHLPKTEVMTVEFDIKAVALAGGAEVAKAAGIEAEIFLEEKKPDSSREPVVEEKIEPEKERVAEVEKVEEVDKEEVSLAKEPPSLGFGFTPEKDIATEKKEEEAAEVEKVEELEKTEEEEVKLVEPPPPIEKELPRKPRLSLFKRLKISRIRIRFFQILSPIKRLFSLIKLPAKLPLLGIIFPIVVLVLGAGLFWLWWFFPKAKVVLFVEPQISEKAFKITLDASAQELDLAQMIIPAQELEEVIRESKEKETTGTKIVGDKAKGEVIIYNRTNKEKTLDGGTVLTGPGGLKFSLNEGVVIASESAGPDYTTIPGKATVSVTASEIGSEGNLASGTEFEVGKFSTTDLIARNDSAFSEGTSREIRVVAKSDQEELSTVLLETLRPRALKILAEKISSEEILVEESLTETVLEESFSKNLEEEAERLKLDLSVRFKALAFQKSKLNSLVRDKIRTTVSSGFEFREEESEVSFELDKVIDEEKALFDASFKASLWPEVDVDQIRSALRGKKPELGQFYLGGLPNLAGYEVVFTPDLPQKIKTFPKVLKNIEIEVRSK